MVNEKPLPSPSVILTGDWMHALGDLQRHLQNNNKRVIKKDKFQPWTNIKAILKIS